MKITLSIAIYILLTAVTGMGTTIVACHFKDGVVSICHVGDSRAYLIRNGSIKRVTIDQVKYGRHVGFLFLRLVAPGLGLSRPIHERFDHRIRRGPGPADNEITRSPKFLVLLAVL